MHLTFFTLFLPSLTYAFPSLIYDHTAAYPKTSSLPSPKTVYQFPNPTWIENIAIRHDGFLIVSLLSVPDLYLINPFDSPPTASLIHSFPPDLGVTGITELTPNKFVVLSGNYSYTTGTAPPGEFAAHLVDFTAHPHSTSAAISKIAQLPADTGVANGIATLNTHTVLITDSTPGRLLALDTQTGHTRVVLEDPASMAAVPNALISSLGINGLKYRDGYAYYTNTFVGALYRVPVDCVTARATGPVETVTAALGSADDFAFTEGGDVLVVTNLGNTLVRVGGIGKGLRDVRLETVAGAKDKLTVAGGTGVAMGRTPRDCGVAYVSTSGGLASPVNGTVVEGGKVEAVCVGGRCMRGAH